MKHWRGLKNGKWQSLIVPVRESAYLQCVQENKKDYQVRYRLQKLMGEVVKGTPYIYG